MYKQQHILFLNCLEFYYFIFQTFFTELLVLIVDVNDNAPQFLMAPYSVSVNEVRIY